jgi:predicted glycosyltransferase
MNILVQLSHPAHFHLYKNAIKNWQDNGHQVHVLIKTKDILEELCQNSQIPYHNILPIAHRKSKFGVLWDMVVRDWKIFRFCIKHKIDILSGSTPEVAHVSRVLGRWSVNTGEDDMAVVPAFAKVTGPFMQCMLSPVVCDNTPLEKHSVHYPSYHELAYLHPNHFTPSREVVEGYGIDTSKAYFILRFASLNAHHDDGIRGINTEVAQKLVDILAPHGQIYITSERELESQFEPYRIRINPLDMHHVMAFASLYIGDSQTMAAEAGVLGTPFVRLNDFVGRLSYIHELEASTDYTPRTDGYVPFVDKHVPEDTHYCLGYGHKTADVEGFYRSIEKWLAEPNRKSICSTRREQMLHEKIDYAKFLTWFIENYPQSAKETKEKQDSKDFWNQFK